MYFQKIGLIKLFLNWLDDMKTKVLNKSWFFIAIRRFGFKLLSYYDTLSEEEKNKLKEDLNKELTK